MTIKTELEKDVKPYWDHELGEAVNVENKICFDCESMRTQHETDEGGLCHFCYYERYLADSPSFDKDLEQYERDGNWFYEIPLYVWKIIRKENQKRYEELSNVC